MKTRCRVAFGWSSFLVLFLLSVPTCSLASDASQPPPAAPAAPAIAAQSQEPLRIATLPLTPIDVLRELAGLYTETTGQPTFATVCGTYEELATRLSQGEFDVVVGTCAASTAKLLDNGLVIRESRKPIYYRRLAILLPPRNPAGIMSAADLERPGLRIGMLSIHMSGPLAEEIGPQAMVLSRDQALLLDLLEQHRLDAVLSWDCWNQVRPELVTIRLPREVAGDGAVMEASAFLAATSKRPQDAQAFVEMCAKSKEAHVIMLRHSLMVEDGSRESEYDTGAAVRFAKVYENIDKQIVDDYRITEGVCIDIGCGPGHMALMLAKMTSLKVIGLDIEPEAIAIGEKHAADAGLTDRVQFVCADAHSLPFPDNYADLIMSRGTLPFLRDLPLAFREAYRVLKPGGVAFMGVGMGRYTPAEEAAKLYPRGISATTAGGLAPGQKPEESIFPFPIGNFDAVMALSGIPNYKVITEGGRWVEIRK